MVQGFPNSHVAFVVDVAVLGLLVSAGQLVSSVGDESLVGWLVGLVVDRILTTVP